MSEFSGSYHLRTNNKEKAIHLLKDANKSGYVFDPINGWATFVIDGNRFRVDDSIISNNPSTLIHYTYAEDHGWSVQIYEKDELVFDYKIDWTDEIEIEKELYDIDVIVELVIQQGKFPDNIESMFEIKASDNVFSGTSPAYQFASKVGLTYYEWISIDYMNNRNLEEHDFITKVD